MRRSLLGLLCLAILAPTGAHAQEMPEHVYLAFYKVDYSDLDEWNQDYREYSVPILEELRAEGLIEGWSQWQHNTGGEYNVRFAVRTSDWASMNTFWNEYLSRLREANPEMDGGMIRAHRDEIWDIGEVHMPEGETDVSHIYVSSFQHDFPDGGEWDRAWTELAGPILAEAMEEGLLVGWVKLNHNTGGPHNSKILYFFEEWGHIDPLFSRLLGGMAEQGAEQFDRIMGMIRAHDDVIWEPTSR